MQHTGFCRVSIPFKRESLSKVSLLYTKGRDPTVSIPFKRESLSKVRLYSSVGDTVLVSIPFKRESLSKVNPGRGLRLSRKVSIPFKRESLSKVIWISYSVSVMCWFQFPSNGKAYPKQPCPTNADSHLGRSFNSLQTGKPIQSWILRILGRRAIFVFQFPSNGKAYPKYRVRSG